MDISIFKIFMIFGIVSTWAKKAFEDGIITIVEAGDLGEQLGAALGIPTSITVPPLLETEHPAPETDAEHPAPETNPSLTYEEKVKEREDERTGGESP